MQKTVLPLLVRLLIFMLLGYCCVPLACAQADSLRPSYPDFKEFGEHAFNVTRNEYIGKIAPQPTRPYETLIYVAIGENEERGYLAITAINVWENELIEGEAIITLGNGTTLSSNKKRLFNTTTENGAQTAVALYFLSFSQLRQISRHGIVSLGFPLVDVRTNSLMPCVVNQSPVKFTGK